MRSSSEAEPQTRERVPRGFPRAHAAAIALGLAIAIAACSSPPAAEAPETGAGAPSPPADTAAVDCVSDASVTAEYREAAAEWRKAVESGPFYSVSAERSAVASCRIAVEDGAVTMDYRFADGGSLRATRDAAIEYSDQQVRFATPPAEGATALLRRAQQAAFGAEGCGIDWQRPTTGPASDDPSAGETVYRGELCNCEARIRTDAAGRATGAALRSTC